jgi:hypothetical protein
MSGGGTRVPRFVWWLWALLLVAVALYVIRGLTKTHWG